MPPKNISMLPTKSMLNTRPILDSFPQKMPINTLMFPLPRVSVYWSGDNAKGIECIPYQFNIKYYQQMHEKQFIFTKF